MRAAGSAHETACVEWRSDEPGPTGPGTRAPPKGAGRECARLRWDGCRGLSRDARRPPCSPTRNGPTPTASTPPYRDRRPRPSTTRRGAHRPRRSWRSHLRSHDRERVVRREGRSEAGSVMPADRVPEGQEPACRQWPRAAVAARPADGVSSSTPEATGLTGRASSGCGAAGEPRAAGAAHESSHVPELSAAAAAVMDQQNRRVGLPAQTRHTAGHARRGGRLLRTRGCHCGRRVEGRLARDARSGGKGVGSGRGELEPG